MHTIKMDKGTIIVVAIMSCTLEPFDCYLTLNVPIERERRLSIGKLVEKLEMWRKAINVKSFFEDFLFQYDG
jgi:hypothetical protein